MADLQGKHVVVTGASAGIGALLCTELGRRGARVVVAARRLELLSSVAEQVRELGGELGGEALPVVCDCSVRESVLALADTARRRFGEIDIWVSNAGAGMRHPLLDATEEDMLGLYRLNALSSLWGYQAVVPRWLKAGRAGQVMDVCSLGGKSGYAFNGGYSAAKHAMSALGDTMRQELLGKGVHITTVYPGPSVSDFGKVSTDRTGGQSQRQVEGLRQHKSLIMRKVTAKQSTAAVVRAMIKAMERPVPVVYPHRWGNLAVALNNLAPRMMLRLMERSAR